MKNENLKSFEGMAKLLIVGGVEEFGDDIEHEKLVVGDLFGFFNESGEHKKDIFFKVELLPISIRE